MSTGTTYKRFKRRFKKKLYHFLVALNEVDFSKFRPVCYLVLIVAMLAALAKLPTSETTNTDSQKTVYGTSLSNTIRTAVSAQDNSTPINIVALFLPAELSEDNTSTTTFDGETLYSFYLTGKELSYLAEGAITTMTKSNTLYLDGLNFTYHKNRLPFNRVTELSTGDGEEITANQLYHIVSTEDIFSLFHYISYRSLGIMDIYPKDVTGAVLSDYQKVLLTETGEPLTIGTAVTFTSRLREHGSNTPSVVTMQSGFNLIDLIKEPNKITICVAALFLAFFALLWYIVPRMNRIRIWFRIYRIRSRKRSTHTLYGFSKRL
ncbi:MAG: 5'-nucleotidase C-terminal domain-containing protein [Lachnospiraceae bacterium]|nr:5'-nucleotidase C-terminal domain-containing protein [Lachnospiraceae bacterium]